MKRPKEKIFQNPSKILDLEKKRLEKRDEDEKPRSVLALFNDLIESKKAPVEYEKIYRQIGESIKNIDDIEKLKQLEGYILESQGHISSEVEKEKQESEQFEMITAIPIKIRSRILQLEKVEAAKVISFEEFKKRKEEEKQRMEKADNS